MGLDDIKKKILGDANAKKDDAIAQANTKKNAILADYRRRASEYSQNLTEKAQIEGEGLKKGIVIDAKLKVKNELLQKKRDLIEQAIADAKTDLISSADYPKMMKGLIMQAIETGKEEVMIADGDQSLNQKWLDAINKETGKSLVFSDEKIATKGGVILKRGNIFMNITIDTLFNEMREEVEKEAASMMF